jgi:2-C-methyl-D-erythritol 2,4-cyclodiphosphate synthase
MRVGWGVDAHRFAPDGQVILAGVTVDRDRGVAATSDGDVLAHAAIDALLGAAAMGDIGSHYPPGDERMEGADSMGLLEEVVALLQRGGWAPASVDGTIIAEEVRVAPHRDAIRRSLAGALGIALDAVSVKATTTDGMGLVGRGEGIAAMVVAVVSPTG